ncbi:FAD-dependent oxidoreductase [Gammaproteobacteria bacterium AS21]
MKKIQLPLDDNSCGWFETLPEALKYRPETAKNQQKIRDSIQTDWLVIGGGFVGMAATRRLAELHPEQKIILVDAQAIGHGTSGRNSGFIIDLPHKGDLEGEGLKRKKKFIALNREAISFLEAQVKQYKIPCDWSHTGKLQAAVSERGVRFLDHFKHLLKELDEPYQVLDKQDLKQKTGTDYYKQALYTPGCVLMQPAALIRGIAQNMPENVTIYEHTPIEKIKPSHGAWIAQTRDAEITANKVILGTNIFTEQLGFLKHRMLPIMTFASMTRPLSDSEFAAYGGTVDWGMTPADYAGTTLRMTKDRRLIVRNQYRYVPQYSSSLDERKEIRAMHRNAMDARYPMLVDVPFEFTWGGVCTLSSNYKSFFGELESGLYASCCHNGVGAARGTISGKLLAEMASGGDSKLQRYMTEVSGMPSRLPPEPALGLGVRTRIKVSEWMSRSEV